MFNTYIKSLNDMVFSTSETPDEQPSTGVLGRIGSWLSPWKAKGPKSPTEDDSPTSDQARWSGEGKESEESVRPWAGEQQWKEKEEEKDHSSGPNTLGLSRDSFLCERRDATQSARRHDSAGADRAHTQRQAQAQAGRRLHVYLEDTSVFHHGQDTTKEVVRTKVPKSLQILQKTKSSPSLDLPNSPTSTSAESRGTNVRPAAEAQSYYSDPVGVPRKSHKDPELEPELDQEQTEADSMGRKNPAKRRQRKNSQGDGGSSPQEKMPPSAQPVPEGSLSSDNPVTSAQGKSPSTHMGEPSENSSPNLNLTSQALPKGGENKTSCSDSDKQLDSFQDSNSVVADTLVRAVDGDADMEEDSSLYKVERKTETPESKRRSMKVSRSEVKFFSKHVPLKPGQNPAGDGQDYKSKLKNNQGEEKEKPKPETNARLQDPKKTAEEPKQVVGRITDKISLFERQQGVEGFKKTFQTPRSADVSPVRRATDRLKAIPELSFQRSKSAERHDTIKSKAGPLVGEKPMTIKERVRNLTEASKSEAKPALPQKQTMTGMSQKSTSSLAAPAVELPERDSQGKLDAKTAKSEITIKPDGRDTTSVGVNISIPKDQPTDSKKTDTATYKAGDQGVKPKSIESDISAKVTADSSETTGDISQLPKGPSRTGSRSKRRKSRDPKSPLSPDSENRSTPRETTSPISPNSENRSRPRETTSPLSPDSENRSTPRDPTSPISPNSENISRPRETTTTTSSNSGNRSTPREPTTTISPKGENKSTPRETTSPISPKGENKSTPREPTSPISSNSGNRSTPREPTSPISPKGENRSTPREPPTPITLKSENKSTPREPTTTISPKGENKSTPRETTSPISPKGENKSTPREPTSPISSNSGNRSTPREPTSPISPKGENRSTPREPPTPITLKSENKSSPREPTSPISPKGENKSTPREPPTPITLKSENKSTPREPPTPITLKSENKSTPREPPTPITLKSENKSTPREPPTPITLKSENKSTPREPPTPITLKSENKSTPREPTSPISPNSENKSTPRETTTTISSNSGNRSTPREPTSPISPKSENKPTRKTEVREQVDNTVVSASKKLTAKVSSSSDEGNTSEKPSLSDAKQKAFKKEADVSEKLKKQVDSSLTKKNVDKPANAQKGLPDPSVNRDEPDAPARNRGTRKPIDKDPVTLPRKEEKAGGLVFTQEREKASKGSGENSAPSPSADQPPSKEQASAVENLKFDKECAVQHDSRSKEKVRQPGQRDKGQKSQPQDKNTDSIKPTEWEDAERQEKSGSENANQTEKKDKDKTQLLQRSDSKTAGGQGDSGKEGKAAKGDERKVAERKEEHIKDRTKQEADKPEASEKTSRSSDDHKGQKGDICAVVEANEAVSQTKPDKGPLKGAIETKVRTESSGTEVGPVVIAAEPQPNSVSVEKTKHSLDDSHTDRANDVEFSSSEPNSKAKAAAEEVSIKASNYTPALINVQTGNMAKEEPSPISVSKPKRSPRAGQDDRKTTVKAELSEEKISGDVAKLVPSSTRMSTEEKAQRRPDSNALKPTVHETERTAEETSRPLPNERPLVPNGDVLSHSQLLTVKKEAGDNKPSQKAPTSPEAEKLTPGSPQRSPMKKLHLPRGLSRDDATRQQDAPSSWLDVDFPKRRLKVSEPKLSYSGSESNLLDTDLDDEDFVEKIKKLCAPFSFPPRKHTQLRPPQPLFAMPAIKEARFEKTFDPEEFKFGLRKKDQFNYEMPSMLAKLKKTEKKSAVKPARASLADRCLLLSSLENDSRHREKTPVNDEDDDKEEKDNKVRVKSRLEGSCVLSSLTSTSFRGKRNGAQTQADASSSGDVSPTSPHQLSPPPMPSPTAHAPVKDTLAKQSSALSGREEAQAAEAVVNDSGPPLPSFNDIKLPDYLEKFLQREPAKPVLSTQGQEEVNRKVVEKMTTVVPGGEADMAVKPGPLLPEAVPPRFPGIPPNKHPALPERPLAQPHEKPAHHIRVDKGFHKRPGKMVLFEKPEFGGQAYEIHRDVADATALQLSPLISVKVVRGCWVLYEKPDFQGRTIALEEGGIELTNMWAEPASETEPQNLPPMLIGSVRLAVWDYSIPHIDLFTEPEGHGRVTPYHDDTIETGSFGVPLSTASIQVHSGVWLLFSDPGFQGMLAVLETGVYPFPEAWGFPSPFVGSLRPLRMGTFKVENPNEVKAVVYEQPGFEGSFLEIDSDVFSFCEDDVDVAADAENLDTNKLKAVGSLKIIGGLWVGYSQPGFEGQQHILEEGEYLDCSEWGGSEQLLSIRPILTDFLSPHLKMFSDRDFGKLGVNIDLTGPVINMDDTGYGVKTQSIDVIGGVWVVFEEPGFCGESYILEKGLYGSPEDWGGLQPRVASAMTVILDDFENAAKFKVQLYSDPGFQGSVVALEDGAASLQDGFSVASCKVVAGNWVAFEAEAFTGRMYVLEIGSYPDLRSMGCADGSSSILSLQTVGFEFSLPSITLFERCGLRGKRLVLTDGCVNLQLAGGCSRVQSVLVEGGMWILYEGINYLGAQILLKPDEIHDWRKLSSWNKIGSLRPLLQKQVHFRVRNRHSGLMMSVTGDLDEVKLMRIQETEETGEFEQIWIHQNGHLHCKLLEEYCLGPSGSLTMAGSRVGLTQESGDHVHLWSITPDGFIRYTHSSNLVLEVKGGHNYDKNQVILNTLDVNKPQQRWDVEII
ncbi:beta/gamma crystallin domain-containing protein 1-like [Hippoglossus hippoglossus]|uniref:beta/gamma crystallin domain-containing protein 1-like n=1 Tax=Hippoglossus hippoglossus TaxID=8267 RepID=UPI00148C146F|nr:beta/gamma crystallin domain-containing protein 1-like [Hippoglossus hippoglossus]